MLFSQEKKLKEIINDVNLNIAIMFIAFAISQGGLLISQSILVARGELGLLGSFGASYTFAVLAYALVDWGGIILLARHELSPSEGRRADFFSSLAVVRGAVAALLVSGIVIWVGVQGIHDFATGYAIATAPAMLIGTLNAGGVLDGIKRSGLTGLTTAAPVVASALVLPVTIALPSTERGLLLGLAFTLGTAVSLVVQFFILRTLRQEPLIGRPSLAGVAVAAREGGLILLTLLPGYTFYRSQVAVAVWLLGPAGTGLFIYSKQIVNGIQQSIYFMRRAEMPRIMEILRGYTTLRDVATAQRTGLIAGAMFATLLAALGLSARLLFSGHIAEAGILAASFSPVIAVSASYATLHQAYVAAHRSGVAALVANSGLAFGIAASSLGVWSIGIYGFPLAELMMALGLLGSLALLWKPVQSSRAGCRTEEAL